MYFDTKFLWFENFSSFWPVSNLSRVVKLFHFGPSRWIKTQLDSYLINNSTTKFYLRELKFLFQPFIFIRFRLNILDCNEANPSIFSSPIKNYQVSSISSNAEYFLQYPQSVENTNSFYSWILYTLQSIESELFENISLGK